MFISHTDRSTPDREFTNLLVEEFRREGIPYWIDREHPFDLSASVDSSGPAPENPLFFHLCAAISSCDLLLFVLSSASVQREFCRLEFDPRVLFGPGAGVMSGRRAVMVKLDNLGESEIEIVLTAICGSSRVFDMTVLSFERFMKAFKSLYQKVPLLPKDDSWHHKLNFQPRAAPAPLAEKSKVIRRAEGRRLLESALTLIVRERLDEAEESLSDAYVRFQEAGDAQGIVETLYPMFVLSLRIGLEAFHRKREIVKVAGLTVRDSQVDALREIRYAMKCLRACADELDELGEPALSQEMRRRHDTTLRLLRTQGIVQVKRRE